MAANVSLIHSVLRILFFIAYLHTQHYSPPNKELPRYRCMAATDQKNGPDYGKPDSQARFWNGMSRPSASVCDAVARDLEHYFPR